MPDPDFRVPLHLKAPGRVLPTTIALPASPAGRAAIAAAFAEDVPTRARWRLVKDDFSLP